MKLLIIEDEKITRVSLANILSKENFTVFTADDGQKGLELFYKELPEIVLTDLRLPKLSGMEILKSIIKDSPLCKVILITAFATVETAVTALKTGAYDYLTKPFSPEKLLSILKNIREMQNVIEENIELKNRIELLENKSIIGSSPQMQKLRSLINQLALSDSTILIEGESGTGKEVTARALHNASSRKNENFVTVSCSSIPESLLESELFGHEKGAFTGAIKRHIGLFERADKGTVFIDDIDDFPLNMQIKLLRVLQEKELNRVGGNEIINIDVRFICATKVNLKEKVEQKLFRNDLYYRLNIIPIILPTLRERKEDIPELIEHFFNKYNAYNKINLVDNLLYAKLMAHQWEGNVRELENVVQRIIALSFTGELTHDIISFTSSNTPNICDEKINDYPPFEEYMTHKEKEIILWALKKKNYSITETAKLLNIPRTTLNSKIDRLNILLTRILQ
ncbi:MAG: sigma-54 dependent transcriptional regulator [bacterium]